MLQHLHIISMGGAQDFVRTNILLFSKIGKYFIVALDKRHRLGLE